MRRFKKNLHMFKNSIIVILFLCITTNVSYSVNVKVDDKAKKIYNEVSKTPKEKLKNLDKKKINIYNTLNDMDYHKTDEYYNITLPFGGNNSEPSELFSREGFLKTQKSINEKLKEKYDYVEFFRQPLCYVGKYNLGSNFAVSKESLNQKIKSEIGNINLITDIQAMQMDLNFFEKNIKSIKSGRRFMSKDFVLENDKNNVKVILGNNYMKHYKLGDEFTLFLYEKKIKFIVVGFLEKNNSIQFDGEKLELDNCVLMPSYDIRYYPKDENDKKYQLIYYSMKNSGYIKATKDRNFDELQRDIATINKRNNLFFNLSDIPTKFKNEK